MPHAEVSVLGGGWSARAFDLQALPGYVIGVNDAGLLGRCDAIVSMDRLWTENRWLDLCVAARPAWIREAALKNVPTGRGTHWLNRFECDHTSAVLAEYGKALNGTNSGLCAVNLAYQMRPRVLRLYGLDGSRGPNGERHWYPDYPWSVGRGTSDGKFRDWRKDLAAAIGQCAAVGIEVRMMVPEAVRA